MSWSTGLPLSVAAFLPDHSRRVFLRVREPVIALFRPFGAAAHDELQRARGAFDDTPGDFLRRNLELRILQHLFEQCVAVRKRKAVAERLCHSQILQHYTVELLFQVSGKQQLWPPKGKARFGSADPAMMNDQAYLLEHA